MTAYTLWQKNCAFFVGIYKKTESFFVNGTNRVIDFFVEKLFARNDESVEEAKERLKSWN